MPDKKRARGAASHTNPNCQCGYCKSRRRKEEAIALAIGSREARVKAEDSIEVGDPDTYKKLLVTTNRGYRYYIQQWLAYRSLDPEISTMDVARKLGVHPSTMYHAISKATREGWLIFSDPIDQIDHQIVPKVVENLNYFLDQKDQRVTIETAKGTIFPTYRNSKGIEEISNTVLALKIEMPESPGPIVDVTGNVVGKPKRIAEDSEE